MVAVLVTLAVLLGAGFVVGVLVGRNNPTIAAALYKVAQDAKAKAEAVVAKVEQK